MIYRHPIKPGLATWSAGRRSVRAEGLANLPHQNARASRDGIAIRSRQARGRTSRKGSSKGASQALWRHASRGLPDLRIFNADLGFTRDRVRSISS